MNVCVVSTFEGTTEDYIEMFNATKEKKKTLWRIITLALLEREN